MKNLIWINDYNLNFDYDGEKIFIFEPEYLKLLAPKRLKLIYKYLVKNNIRIFQGEYLEVINNLLARNLYRQIIIPQTVDHKIIEHGKILAQNYQVKYIATDAILYEDCYSRRFFKFWNKIKDKL